MTKILMEREREFTTDQIIRIDSQLYFRRANGGSRGAWQDREDTCNLIDLAEGRRIALEWGEEPEDVARIITLEVEEAETA
jgi:hypothetical protein